MQLKRLLAEDEAMVEMTVREACRRLLGIEQSYDADDCYTANPADAATVGRAAKYIASRICVPRDMGAPAAAALRCTLLQMGDEAEAYAWGASGGLL